MSIRFYQQWYDLFNNFSANAVEFDGVIYPTAEHAYQAAKCLDQTAKEQVKLAKSPIEAKNIANNQYIASRDPEWESKKLDVMELVLRAKLAQHDDVKAALKRSGNDVIEEDSKEDSFWGIGDNGQGQNHLGKLWMKIRSEI